MNRLFFTLLAVAFPLSAAACAVPDVPIPDTGDGSAHDGSTHDGSAHDGSTHDGSAHDGSTHDGSAHDGSESTGDATEDGKSPHRDAGEMDASNDDARAPDDGAVDREASCPDAEALCTEGGTCVNEQTDPKNCGGCGNDCTLAPHVDPKTTTCAGGQCVYACLPGFADDCSGSVGPGCPTSLSTATNCGSCGHACTGATSLCSPSAVDGGAAACTSSCSGGTFLCNDSCVNDQTDPSACGTTCTVCPYICVAGGCTGTCSPGTTGCSGSQPQVCGTNATWQNVGSACGACEVCSGGGCVASTGGSCNDGNACTQTDTCENGVCMGSNPVTCTASDRCHVAGTCNTTSGVCSTPLAPGANCTAGQACNPWYPDCDEDAFGSSSATPVYSCSLPTGAPGCGGVYVGNNSDCCDTDKNVHPGQQLYFTTPDACGSTTQAATPYDYNCNGADEVQSNGPTDCTAFTCTLNGGGTACVMGSLPADCDGVGANYGVAACGAPWQISSASCSDQGGECRQAGASGPGGTQACR